MCRWTDRYKEAREYLYGTMEAEPDEEAAHEIMLEEAEQGNAYAMHDMGKRPSSQLDRIMENRMCGNFSKNDENLIQITSDDTCDYYGQTIATIVNDGDCAGAVVMCAGEEKEFQGEVAGKLVKTAADFLSKQIG